MGVGVVGGVVVGGGWCRGGFAGVCVGGAGEAGGVRVCEGVVVGVGGVRVCEGVGAWWDGGVGGRG